MHGTVDTSETAPPPRPHFFRANPCEHDPAFRQQVQDLTRRGLFFVGMAAVLMPLIFLAFHVWAGGRELSWTYTPADISRRVVLWDKLVLVALGAACMAYARLSRTAAWGRLLVSVLLLVGCAAILADDFLNRNVEGSAAYVALVLLVVASTIPFRPQQMLALSAAAAALLPALVFLQAPPVRAALMGAVYSHAAYMTMATVLLTGITGLLYRLRVEQFLSQRRLERLNEELHSRTAALEFEKMKTEDQAHRLQDLEAAKSAFFTDISHELRTPLTLIMGPAQDALSGAYGPLDSRLESHLGLLLRNARHLRHLIDELLDLSRIEAGRRELDVRKHDLCGFLRDCVGRFALHAERAGVTLSHRCEIEHFPYPFDAKEFEKVIDNLLTNAIKFTPSGGRVGVALEADEEVRVRIRDTGMGIPPEDLPHVFDRFFRASNTSKEIVTGLGIGLALSQEIVELHGGTLHAESELGFGTTMVITLPTVAESGAEERADDWLELEREEPDLSPVPPDGSDSEESAKPLVLVADDNEDVRRYVADLLSGRYRVCEASNGNEAWDLARERLPSLVVSDVMMPGIDGYEVCRRIRSHAPTAHIPIVLLTVRATEEARIAGLESGADDYLVKPFSAAELLVRVENLIELRARLARGPSGPLATFPVVEGRSPEEEAFVARIREVIGHHIGDSNFGVEWLADEMALSTRQLQRRIHADLGLTAGGLIRLMRLQHAGDLLGQHAVQVGDLAARCGFRDPAYFARLFRQTYSVTPSEFGAVRSVPA